MAGFGNVTFGSAGQNYNPNKDVEVPSPRKSVQLGLTLDCLVY